MSVVSFEEMEGKRQEMIASFKDVANAMTRCVALIEDFTRVSPNALPTAAALSTIENGALLAEQLVAAASGGKKHRLRKEKKPKDPNAPKRPPSAYLLFQNEIRDSIRADNPGMAYKEVLGVIANRWKALSDAEKRVYESAYSLATEEFRKADTAYKTDGTVVPTTNPAAAIAAAAAEESSSDEESSSEEEVAAPIVAVTPSKKDKKRKGAEASDKKSKKKK